MISDFEERGKKLGREIETLKMKEPKLNYIECTVEVCEANEIEFESLKKLLPKNIQEKIEIEAMELNLLNYKINTLF